MSVVSKRTKTTTRHEYTAPSPACWTDVQFAMELAAEDRAKAGLSNDWQDVIKVEADDEHVIVFWEEVSK
jgi:hypothetical protein